MKRIYLITLLAGAFIAIGIGCTHKKDIAPSNNTHNNGGGGNNGGTTNDTALCFERDILPIFQSNCAMSGCHDPINKAEGFDLSSYNGIVSKDFTPGNPNDCEIYDKITETDPQKIMPPPPKAPLTTQQIALIRRWITIGALNTTNCGSGGCDTNKYLLAANVQPILNTNCRGCHSTAGPAAGIALDNYNGILAIAQDGRLVKSINHAVGVSPMPKGGNKMSACNIRVIEKWVAAGMLNN